MQQPRATPNNVLISYALSMGAKTQRFFDRWTYIGSKKNRFWSTLILLKNEAFAKLALIAKFDDFDFGSFFCKSTYLIGHRRFAKKSNPTSKAQIWSSKRVLQKPLKR